MVNEVDALFGPYPASCMATILLCFRDVIADTLINFQPN